jgi:acetate kinase
MKKASFWWKDILKLTDKFRGMTEVHIIDEKTCRPWEDIWNDIIPEHQYPELFSFTRRKGITINEAKTITLFHTAFHLSFSEEAYSQYRVFNDALNSTVI